VPVIYEGEFQTEGINYAMTLLEQRGSVAAPGFRQPEGIVIYHHATKTLFKKTLEKDAEGKGETGEENC